MKLPTFLFLCLFTVGTVLGLTPLNVTYDQISYSLGDTESFKAVIIDAYFDADVYVNGRRLIDYDHSFNNLTSIQSYPIQSPLCLGPSPLCLIDTGFCQNYSESLLLLMGIKKIYFSKKNLFGFF